MKGIKTGKKENIRSCFERCSPLFMSWSINGIAWQWDSFVFSGLTFVNNTRESLWENFTEFEDLKQQNPDILFARSFAHDNIQISSSFYGQNVFTSHYKNKISCHPT